MAPPAGRPRSLLPVLAAIGTVALDQAAKQLVVAALGPAAGDHRLGLVEPWLALHYVENTGAAFGALRGQSGLLTVIAVLVLGGMVAAARRAALSTSALIALGLIIGGALGNLIDRLRLGYVIDFVAVGIWPKFNVADSAITIGAALLAWWWFWRPVASQTRQSPPPAATSASAHD